MTGSAQLQEKHCLPSGGNWHNPGQTAWFVEMGEKTVIQEKNMIMEKLGRVHLNVLKVFLLIIISPNSPQGPQHQEECPMLHVLLLPRADQRNAEPGKRGETPMELFFAFPKTVQNYDRSSFTSVCCLPG